MNISSTLLSVFTVSLPATSRTNALRRLACGGYRSKRGFTLMEMIIVLSIIALLMGLVIMNLGGVQDVAKIKKAKADIIAFKIALSTYQMQTGVLPTTDQGLKALWEKPTTDPIPDQWHRIMDEEVVDPWGHPYKYQNPGKHNPDGYDIYSTGEDGQDGTDDDIGNWSTAKPTQ